MCYARMIANEELLHVPTGYIADYIINEYKSEILNKYFKY